MTVINTNRTAHCPLCKKSVNRRSIIENEKVGTLVEKARNLIDNIGKDTGYDITSHNKLPSSTREAVIASPQFHQKKHETPSVQRDASPHKVSNSAVTTSKEQWLKRYKGSYPGKRDSTRDNIDLLSISQVEPVVQSLIARDIALLAVESKVEKLKVPPIEKVQEWLQRNAGEFDKAPVRSSESNTVTISADVHRALDEEPDLVSVSQQQFYIAPRTADVGALRNSSKKFQGTYDKVKQAYDENRICSSRVGNESNTKPCEKVREGQNVEDDPYEFIISQKTGVLSKKKLKREKKCETAVQKTFVKNFKICDPSSKRGDNKNPNEKNTLSCNSPPVSDFTFVCPVEINDTFDDLVANTCKPEPTKTLKMDATKVVAGDDNSDDMCLFRTPLEVPVTSQNNGGSTTESMSDVDFSSGSSEEWGESNKVKQVSMQVRSRRTRSSSHNLSAKKSPTRSTSRQTAGKKSSGIYCRKNEKLKILRSTSKEASKGKLQVENPVKPKPLSPVKKVNPNTNVENLKIVNMKQHPAVCNDSNKKSEDEFLACLSTDKAHPDKENVICPVNVKYDTENKKNLEHTAVNTTLCLRSPGWSRISQSRKDFERLKKPALKALNVSGGEVCTSKKHVTSVSEVPTKPDTNEVMSPLPSIDDSDSSFGIPVVAFDSPEAPNRVKMMSGIVMDLESKIGLNSSTANIAEITTETCTPHTTKDWTLKKNISLGSDAFSEPANALDSPMSCQRKELIHAVLSSLEDDDQLEHQCCESNEQIMSGITKLSGGERASQEKDKKKYDNVNKSVVDTPETVFIVQESNSTMARGEAAETNEHNHDNHNKDNGNIKNNPVVDNSETVFIVQESNSIVAHEEATENTEYNQDNYNKDNSNMKNNTVVDSNKTVLMVQESNTTLAHEEATKNIEHNQDDHIKGYSNIMKNLVVDISRNNALMFQGSCSTKRHEEAAENTEYVQDNHNKDNGNFMNNCVFDIGKKNVVVCQESQSIAAYDKAVENIQQNPMVDQNMIPTDRDCMEMNRSLKPITECGESPSPEYVNNQTERSVEAVHNGNINTEQFPANSSLVASSEDLQAQILSEKCSQERLAVLSSDMIINSKAQENSFFIPCSTKEPQLQPQTMSTELMEMKTENFHESEIWSSCNSSVGLVNSYPNKMHIPFIKCGRLTPLKLFTKFVLLGSLAPRRNNVSPESLQYLSSADSLRVQSDLLGREPLKMNCEIGTQTSPVLLEAKINPTQENQKLVQFTTPTGTIYHTPGHSEDFVPDSCGSKYAFPCAVPLPHTSLVQQTLVYSNKCSEAGDSLTICGTSELLNVNKGMKDNSAEDDVNMNKTALLRNQCEYTDPVDYMDHEIPTSQFSMAKTVKVQHISISDKGGHSPELPSNPMVHTGLNAPILQETNTGKSISSNQDNCNTCTNQTAVSDIQYGKPLKEERNAKSHKQNEMFVSRIGGFAEQLTEVLHSENSEYMRNNYGNTSGQKSSKRSSKASRQLTFSPNFIPKLSDPNLDVNTEDGESTVQQLHKKSYKRIRVAPASPDSVSAGSDSNDMSDAENRGIKRPCHISLKKASGNCKDRKVLVSKEDAETSPEVINLVTGSSSGCLNSEIDDKTNTNSKWLEEDVPDSEELMARVMTNIEADLVEMRKRKMREGNDRQEIRRESPTLFTPPFVADSEEMGSRITCEPLVSDSEAERKKMPHKKSFLLNTAVGNESESLSTQQRNKIQADIHNLETEIKECEAELQKVTKNISTGNSHHEYECGDSENESDDFVEPTPKGQSTSNKSWDAKAKDDGRPEIKEVHFQQPVQGNLTSPLSTVQNTEMRIPLHNPDPNYILPGRSPSVINSTEIHCKQTGTPTYQNAVVKSHAVSPKSKQTVLQLPHKNSLSNLPKARAEKVGSGVIHISSLPANSSNTMKILTPPCVSEPVLPQPSPQISTVQRPPPTRLCFVCSGLHTGLIARVKALSKLLGAEFSSKFEPHTTHLVVKASDTMMAEKTLKYLSAVVKKTWIVSIAWVNACLQARKLVPEDEYEMLDSSGENGPHRSRASSSLLYKNFEFCCIEPFTDLSREQLEGILEDCGGIIVNHPKKFSFKTGHCSMIIIQMNAKREEECKEWWEHYGVLSVGHEWVLECIGRYRIIPIWSFLTCAVNEDHIRTLGYPEDALASDDDDETVVESQV